jgi:MPBQ/MSBQ methyltransferase
MDQFCRWMSDVLGLAMAHDDTHIDTLTQHYASATLASEIDQSLRVLGKDPARLSIDDLELIDEFHIGGRVATRALMTEAGFPRGAHILDVGSGIGGPARVAAHDFGLTVDGIDLTPAYVAAASDLSRRTGLTEQTRFVQGSALALPFASGHFDGATLIHVGMNIADKVGLAREVARVLKPGAVFAIYDIMRTGVGDLTFPLPWSSVAETSAVAAPVDYRRALDAAGFVIESERDRRALSRTASQSAGPPPALPHRGSGWDIKTANLAMLVRAGILAPVELIARKAA